MMNDPAVIRPRDLGPGELAEFALLVRKGEEVMSVGLPERIQRAHWLAFIRAGTSMVAVGAIKNPHPQHRESVKNASGYRKLDLYEGELGYLYVESDQRGNKMGTGITKKLLEEYRMPIFATTRTDNDKAQTILRNSGFITVGQTWPSAQKPDKRIMLWILER